MDTINNLKVYIIKAFAMLLCLFFISQLYVNGQNSIQKEITDKFQKYVKDVPWEEVYIHTDRNEYIAGEQIWFNAYVIDRQSLKPSDESRVVYIEFLNSDNTPVARKKVGVIQGSGPGEIQLPDTLSSGRYTLRAYTNRMRNFFPDNCFTSKINIYNALTGKDKLTLTKPPAGRKNDSQTERSYYLSDASAFNFNITNQNKDTLELLIAADNNFRSKNNNTCFVAVESHGNLNQVSAIRLSGEKTSYGMGGKILSPGINHITFIGSDGQPLAERFIYSGDIKGPSVINGASESFGRREKITVDFILSESLAGASRPCDLSVSAIPVTTSTARMNLEWYLVFGTEYGDVPDNIRYTDPDKLDPAIINSFLSNVHSQWINWKEILSEDKKISRYQAEKDNHFITGRMINKESRLPLDNEYLFLSIPGKNAAFQYARTDKDGKFTFKIPVNESVKDIVIQPEIIDKNNSIEILSSFAEDYSSYESGEGISSYKVPEYLKRWGTNYQVNRIYGVKNSKSIEKPAVSVPNSKRFYGNPDIGLIMDDYIKLPVMEEVFFELIPGVSLKTRKSKSEITLKGSPEYSTYSKPPVLMVDGVIIKDAAVISNLDPEIVEKIDVIKERYIVGDYVIYGLINVITRSGDFSHVTLPDYAVRLRYRVFDPELSFTSPDYSTDEARLDRTPDFRNTLYWSPSVKPSEDGRITVEFYSSDLPGDYEIDAQGFTVDGKPVSFRKTINVR